MSRYYVKEAFLLQSHKPSPKLLNLGMYYQSESDDEVVELQKFEKDGSCEERKSLPLPELHVVTTPKKEVKVEVKVTDDDIATVPGVGKTLAGKLAEVGITNKTQLMAALNDPKQAEDMVDLLGNKLEKIKASLAA